MVKDEIHAWGESEITCPFCEEVYTRDSWEYASEDILECENESCNKQFRYSRRTEVFYDSIGLCKENNQEHNWVVFDHPSESRPGTRVKGRRCLTCGKYEFDKD